MQSDKFKTTSIQVTLLAFVLGFVIGMVLMYGCTDKKQQEHDEHVHIPTTQPTTLPQIVQRRFIAEDPMYRDMIAVTEEAISMLVLLFSAPNATARRHGVRETWLQMASPLNVTAKFLIGTDGLNASLLNNLTVENEEFNDMLLFPDVHDSFHNLTLKLLKGILWAQSNVDFDYLMKADDDSYVRLDQAIAGIRNIKETYRSKLYWGYFEGSAIPRPTGKYEEHNWLKCPHYFPYSLGACYILAKPVVSMMVRFSEKLYTGYNNDDVSIGSWLTPYDIVRIHDVRFTFNMSSAACNTNYIASHLHTVATLHEHYRRIASNVTLCDEDVEAQGRYVYDWTAYSPMKCCKYKADMQLKPFHNTHSAFSRNNRFFDPA